MSPAHSQGEAYDFAAASEYAKHSEGARARSHFADGRAPLLLYTERAHFYNRHRLRGVKASLLCSSQLKASNFLSRAAAAAAAAEAATAAH